MSDDPLRLFDDPNAPAAMRGDLERTANAAGLPYDQSAGLVRLTAALGALPPPGGGNGAPPPSPGAGAAGGGASTAGAAGASATGAGSVFGSGIFWGFMAAGVVCAGVVLTVPPASPVPPRTPDVTTTTPAPASTTSRAEQAHSQVEMPANALPSEGSRAPSAPTAPPAPAQPMRAPTSGESMGGGHIASPADNGAPAGPSPRASSEIALEVEDLAALRAAAHADPARAIDLAAAGEQRFAHGIFGEEREAIAIAALARSGRHDEAKRRAEAFLAHRPRSVFAEDVRRAGGL